MFVALPHDVQNVTTVLIVSKVIAYMEFAGILVYHMMEYSPVGPFVFDTCFKLQRRYRRWREKRRETILAKVTHMDMNMNVRAPFVEQFDLVLRASDCTDSDYEDESESDDDSMKETSDHLQEGDGTKEASGEKDDQSVPEYMSLNNTLTAPLLNKIQGNAENTI